MPPWNGLSLLEKAIADVAISHQTQSLHSFIRPPALFPQSEMHHIEKRDASSLWSALVIPLTIRDQFNRVLIIARQQPKGPYLPTEISLANDLASRASIALENAMLMGGKNKGCRPP